jgi:hypothetical protein
MTLLYLQKLAMEFIPSLPCIIVSNVWFAVHIKLPSKHWHGAHGSLTYWLVVVAQPTGVFVFGTVALVPVLMSLTPNPR